MKKYLTLLVVPVLLVTLIVPRGAQAATPNLSLATLQQIVTLYEAIFRLQMQLIALQGGTTLGHPFIGGGNGEVILQAA